MTINLQILDDDDDDINDDGDGDGDGDDNGDGQDDPEKYSAAMCFFDADLK